MACNKLLQEAIEGIDFRYKLADGGVPPNYDSLVTNARDDLNIYLVSKGLTNPLDRVKYISNNPTDVEVAKYNSIKNNHNIKPYEPKAMETVIPEIRDKITSINPNLKVEPKGNKYTLEITDSTGFKALLKKNEKSLSVYTGGNTEGGGRAADMYDTIFEVARAEKLPYKADYELSFVNQKRLTANMLAHVAKHKKGNSYVIISKDQWGSEGLAGKPLTMENAKKLASNMVRKVEQEYLDKPLKSMSSSEIEEVSKELGGMANVRLGKGIITRLQHYARTGNIAGILGVIETYNIIEAPTNVQNK